MVLTLANFPRIGSLVCLYKALGSRRYIKGRAIIPADNMFCRQKTSGSISGTSILKDQVVDDAEDHAKMLPIRVDSTMIDHWCKAAIVFKCCSLHVAKKLPTKLLMGCQLDLEFQFIARDWSLLQPR